LAGKIHDPAPAWQKACIALPLWQRTIMAAGLMICAGGGLWLT
jgi:hypothetical protein